MTTMTDVSYEVQEIGPARARELLVDNTHNRNLRKNTVSMYAADMSNGTWRENGEAIKIAANGTVIDGQHRLHAIAESGTTQRVLVVSGLDMSTQETMDGGRRRSFADALKLRGESNYTGLAAGTRLAEAWSRGVRTLQGAKAVASNSQLFAFLDAHPELRAAVDVGTSTAARVPLPASSLTLCAWLLYAIKDAEEDADVFFARLVDGANLNVKHPIAVLRRTMVDNVTGRGRMHSTMLTALTIKAWNAYRDGREITLLRYRPGGAHPEAFPEPI